MSHAERHRTEHIASEGRRIEGGTANQERIA